MPGPLAGLTILDLTSVVLGPYATQLCADMGARVIKIEPPTGDMVRQIGKSKVTKGMGPIHLTVNRGKESLCLDLKRPEGKAAFLKLAAKADALFHNMRPEAIDGLGLDYESVRAANPTLVYVGAYGFGTDGPYAARPAYDDIVQGISGVAGLLESLSGEPRYAPTILCDKTTGLMAALALVTALLGRARSGQGQKVEVPMFETMASFMMVEHLWERAIVADGSIGYTRMLSPDRRPYRTKDGYVCATPYADKHWKAVFEAVGRGELMSDPRFATINARSQRINEVYALMSQLMRERTTAEWLALFEREEIPAAPVQYLADLPADPHMKAVGLFREVKHPSEGEIRQLRSPIRFFATGGEMGSPAPTLGQHTRALLAEAGLAPAEIDAMIAAGTAKEG
ncbi:MAG: CoA transferase [Alphaproteobacteria bacterium]|nr:CoA transferase [Alphaproteobacteria bacterium]